MPGTKPARVAATVLAMLSVATALACGDPLAPDDVAGTYALQRVGADDLPTVLFANEYVRIRVLADTVHLSADGTGIQVSVHEIEPLVDGIEPEGPTRGDAVLRFQTVNGRVEIAYICPPNANCAPPPHLVARRVAEGLRMDFALGERVPQHYVRVTGSD